MRLCSLVSAWIQPCRAIGLLGFTVVSLFYSAYAYSAGLGGCDIITSCLKPGALTDTVRVALSISLIATHPGTRQAVVISQGKLGGGQRARFTADYRLVDAH